VAFEIQSFFLIAFHSPGNPRFPVNKALGPLNYEITECGLHPLEVSVSEVWEVCTARKKITHQKELWKPTKITLPKTSSSPLKIDRWTRRFLFKTTIFRCYVSFREGEFQRMVDFLVDVCDEWIRPSIWMRVMLNHFIFTVWECTTYLFIEQDFMIQGLGCVCFRVSFDFAISVWHGEIV